MLYFVLLLLFFCGGGGVVGGGGTSLSHVSQLLEVPGCFFHNSDNNNSFVKLQFSPFGTYASVGLENWGKQ